MAAQKVVKRSLRLVLQKLPQMLRVVALSCCCCCCCGRGPLMYRHCSADAGAIFFRKIANFPKWAKTVNPLPPHSHFTVRGRANRTGSIYGRNKPEGRDRSFSDRGFQAGSEQRRRRRLKPLQRAEAGATDALVTRRVAGIGDSRGRRWEVGSEDRPCQYRNGPSQASRPGSKGAAALKQIRRVEPIQTILRSPCVGCVGCGVGGVDRRGRRSTPSAPTRLKADDEQRSVLSTDEQIGSKVMIWKTLNSFEETKVLQIFVK